MIVQNFASKAVGPVPVVLNTDCVLKNEMRLARSIGIIAAPAPGLTPGLVVSGLP